MNVARTVRACVMETVQVPVPVQPSPYHPAKADPNDGVAARVTFVLMLNGNLQVGPQLMPVGLLVTRPAPDPASSTLSSKARSSKFAVTLLDRLRETMQVSMPAQSPLQPAKRELEFGIAATVFMSPK